LVSLFFFAEVKREVRRRFGHLYGGAPNPIAKRAGSGKVHKQFGWYLTYKRLAESGLFTIGGKSPMESAGLASLYEAFTYLNTENALQELEKNMNEEAAKERARKRR
jgi:hypothetical protein